MKPKSWKLTRLVKSVFAQHQVGFHSVQANILLPSRLTGHDDLLAWLADHHSDLPTPLYLYDESVLSAAAASFRQLFPKEARCFYSLKANPQPGLVRHLASLGLGAEVASRQEWEICASGGVDLYQVLVGGVSKSAEWLATLCDHNVAGLVIESETEWHRLKAAAPASRRMPILLRINPGVAFGGLNMAGGSQFGLSPESGMAIARECAQSSQVDFLGLHFYFGSQRLTVDPILQAVDTAGEIITLFRQDQIDIRVVDLGLGCGVPYLSKDQPLDWQMLCEQLQQRWRRLPWSSLTIWSEAGRALAAEAGTFVARVLERKELHGKTFIFLDGGLNVHNPGVGFGRFLRGHPGFLFVTGDSAEPVETVDIVGNLCTSADSLGSSVAAPRLAEGDLVIIPNSGAYCMTTALWGFNSQPLFAEAMLTENGTLDLLQPQHHPSQTN